MDKVKKKLTINAFRATQTSSPPFPSLRIESIDERSIIHNWNALANNKGKGILFGRIIQMKSLKKNEGWSLKEINRAMEESLRIHALKDNLNPFSGISP